MSDFLANLSTQINNQFSVGENTSNTLDSVVDGKTIKYGSLGNIASKMDQSQERKYLEEGFLRTDPYNAFPKQFQILMQQPSASVFVKKRMFSSIAENFRSDFMDKDEKLYYKTIKVLFQNKCRQISTLEKLAKVNKLSSLTGNISDAFIPIILSLSDSLQSSTAPNDVNSNILTSGSSNSSMSGFFGATEKMRRYFSFNNTNYNTSWITDAFNLFKSQFGEGTGVIEITNFTSINTSCDVESINNSQSASFNIEDPYQMMLITEYDIERAIADATNMFYNNQVFQFGQQSTDQLITTNINKLNELRAHRRAGSISIKVDANTLLGKRIRAIIDRSGTEILFEYNSAGIKGFPGLGGSANSVTIDPIFLQANSEGLSEKEAIVFKTIIAAMYNSLQLSQNSQNAIIANNQNTNYVRKKIRFNFLGKLLIQPMDVVNIYFGTKSKYDNKLLGGISNSFNGLGFMQQLNNTMTNFNNIKNLFDPSNSVNFQIEKASYVGNDFPNYLWTFMRNEFVVEKQGAHVYGGVVTSATSTWGDGKFSVGVSCSDNTYYFDQGQVNFKPGADTFNGAFFDPLTPFKSNFDTIASNSDTPQNRPQLLEENEAILGYNKTIAIVKAKAGPNAGEKVTQQNLFQDMVFDDKTRVFNKVFYAPDGLVYKWKEGIGVFTQFGGLLNINDSSKVGNQNAATDPFAGQDIMNVISLSITGLPYNFYTYWKASTSINGASSDALNGKDAVYNFADSLRSSLTKNNTIWGNFIPFKNLVLDEQSLKQTLMNQANIQTKNNELNKLLLEFQKKSNEAITYGYANIIAKSGDPSIGNSNVDNPFNSEASELQLQLNKKIDEFKQAQIDNSIIISGSDIMFDTNAFIDNSSKKFGNDGDSKRIIRRQINALTRRMSYNVKSNEDKNLFIVDDFYDNDYDILAYEKAMANLSLYSSQFASVRSNIQHVANLLNLEVFADTQGHIRCRPPQYNRMPSSVFYKMMHMKDTLGIQVFPDFLNKIFTDQISSLRERIEVIEDYIRLDCAVLGYNTDALSLGFINQQTSGTGAGAAFSFISSEKGNIAGADINILIDQSNPDSSNQSDAFSTISTQALSTKSTFTPAQRALSIQSELTRRITPDKSGVPIINPDNLSSDSTIQKLTSRIQTKSGDRVIANDYRLFLSSPDKQVAQVPTEIDIFKVTNELSTKIGERQKLVKLFYKSLKSANEFRSLDKKDSNITNKLLAPELYDNKNVPEVLQHMIEDETYDDLGPGSGSRYIIKDAQITSMNIAEHPPEYTYAEVQGVLNEFKVDLPEGLNSFPGGGNGMVTAAAVDYDSWRNYGFKFGAPIKVPFLNDPQKQCAPYASMLLSRNRKNILRGSVTIQGNEYMQPGEVVYLESRGLLFYIKSVSHSYQEGSNFTTQLSLTYGHTAGEYIPTVFDMIGKLLYNNKDDGTYQIHRQANGFNEQNLGILILNSGNNGTDITNDEQAGALLNDPKNSFSEANKKTINNILYSSSYLVNGNKSRSNDIDANIELRVYYDNNNPIDTQTLGFAQQIKQLLTYNAQVTSNPNDQSDANNLNSVATGGALNSINGTGTPLSAGNKSMSEYLKDSSNQAPNLFITPADAVKIIQVNLDDENDSHSPSQQALSTARDYDNMGSIGTSDANNKIRRALFGYVVDCWIVIAPNNQQSTDVTSTTAGS